MRFAGSKLTAVVRVAAPAFSALAAHRHRERTKRARLEFKRTFDFPRSIRLNVANLDAVAFAFG